VIQKEEAELWCIKCRRNNEASVVLRRGHDRQKFQDREFVVYGCDDLLQTRSRHVQGDATNAIAVLECKHYALFVFCGEATISEMILKNERKGRGMCQHIRYGSARRTNEAETQVGCCTKDEVSPSSTGLRELVPPPFVAPIPLNIAVCFFLKGTWSTEIKYVEKRIVVEDVDKWTGWFPEPGPGLLASR
jgi:hypothetical protein